MATITNATNLPLLVQQRPLRVAALQWTPTQEGFDRESFFDFLGKAGERIFWRQEGHIYLVITHPGRGGTSTVWPGMWVLKDYTGKLTTMHDETFKALWEPLT